MQTTAQQFRQFIQENFLFDRGNGRLSDEDSFLENGVIDSTGVLELITFVETQFGVTVEDSDVVPENLDSIRSLVTFVDRKRSRIKQEENAIAG